MMPAHSLPEEAGFSLLELMVASVIFMVLCGAAFGLLGVSQQAYQSETQVLNSFQEARLGLDQIVRDINDSGYPPPGLSSVPPPANLYASTPVAWSPNYPGTPCAIGVTCGTPGDFDLILETNIDPQNTNVVSWIRYQLKDTTLYRGIVNKTVGGDPDAATLPTLAPLVQNVVNNGVPIFRYMCDTPDKIPAVQPCSLAGPANVPINVRDVEVTLIVATPTPDPRTGKPRVVELDGRGHRLNPFQ